MPGKLLDLMKSISNGFKRDCKNLALASCNLLHISIILRDLLHLFVFLNRIAVYFQMTRKNLFSSICFQFKKILYISFNDAFNKAKSPTFARDLSGKRNGDQTFCWFIFKAFLAFSFYQQRALFGNR